ncbi:MAG TPA: hypothetical protein VFK69_12735 [Candidatus Eisenbacteria bacterium]|nr:hypothetical protein [Candidatus Eisenbacteria bacterium]
MAAVLAACALASAPSAHAAGAPASFGERLEIAGDAPASRDPGIGPSSAEVAKLRRQIGSKSVRAWLARGALLFPRADLDTVGIWFAASQQRVVAVRPPAQPHASPLEWNEVERLEVRRSHVLAGTLIGAGVGLAFVRGAFNREAAPAVINAAAAAGSIGLGAGIGALASGWRTVWRRPRAQGVPTAPPAGPPSAVASVGKHARSPSQALTIGIGATLAPAIIAVAIDRPGSDREFAWEAALGLGGEVGALVGPSVGLTAGGRWDLAKRGLIIRGVAAGGMVVGALGVGMAFEDGNAGTGAMVILGLLAGGAQAFSTVYDLAITPSATAKGRRMIAHLEARPDGKLALVSRF